jgi:protein-S-isoprenylcysteine O-methyltransferase Ste14
MGVADTFYSIATGPARRRLLLTPVGLVLFVRLFVLVVAISLWTDHQFDIPALLPGPLGAAIGVALLTVSLPLWAWCVVLFAQGGGTPIPLNPPPTLVVRGPYRRVRNPMLVAVFATLVAIAFLLHSASMALLWAPLYLLANLLEITRVEQPELERRLGEPYREYRAQVPMIMPCRARSRGSPRTVSTRAR